jgi:hypothetical protein
MALNPLTGDATEMLYQFLWDKQRNPFIPPLKQRGNNVSNYRGEQYHQEIENPDQSSIYTNLAAGSIGMR